MDKQLSSVERLIGITMILMGFLNILISFNFELNILPVMMFFFGIILFVHASVETWHKWGVIGLVIAAGILFKVNPSVGPYYKMILFYGTIATVIYFILSHRITKKS